ncbi:uncharacterized protein LOC110982645 [Acanthaster planci]|uniref:Uncharacterized protein LOC110982645 n=1 Tax=Acanthaster planci TaxID=133434 RepID=A0A8B7YUD8_ACAPL|nr:uncharacterized protein LOC110982645 [Acanthaster planci]
MPQLAPTVLLALLAFAVTSGEAALSLRELSSVYLPYDYTSGGVGLYTLGAGASEQSAYDKDSATVYTVGDRYLHVVDYSDVRAPSVVHHARLSSTGNDVEFCQGLIGVAVDGQPGTIELYRPFDPQAGLLPLVASVPVGSRPDMLKFTHDCMTIVVANEGEPYEESGYIVDNEGMVSIIHLDNLDTAVPEAVNLDFKSFNARADEYVRRGVRWPYKGELGQTPNTLSQSLEPEYVTINTQDTKAYINLQENNAVAVVDLVSETIVDIYPLGFKSWKDYLLDPSDSDSGINFGSYDIYSTYQPDSIKYMEVDGVEYIVTANEGADMEFVVGNKEWTESQRGKDFVEDDQLSDLVPSEVRSALADNAKLGRLRFSTVDGRNSLNPDKFDRLYFYGSRSVSIFRADDFSLVYDSGDEIERQHGMAYPALFNADNFSDDLADESPVDTFDSRSDNKGAEAEAVELGEVNGKRVMFVGNERTSALMVYTFESGSLTPVVQSIQRFGESNNSFADLYTGRKTGNLDPEDLRFIKASDTPFGKPLLLVTSTISGTVAMYEVVDGDADNGDDDVRVVLSPLSTVYIPYDYSSEGNPKYGLDGGASEQSAYDPVNAMAYTVGNKFLHIMDISDVTRPTIVQHEQLPTTGNDIELCGGLIGVALDGTPGTLNIYGLYDSQTGQIPLVQSIQVGSRPDMLKFTPDCRTLLVANEGETVEDSGYIVDNEGSVTILRLDGSGWVVNRTDLDFTSFNARASDYVARGVRWPYRGQLSENLTSFSQSLEPEYITINKDATKAYICLQENNAIAVIDLRTDTIIDIYPLGFKSWKSLLLDPSDKDGGINFAAYDIYSMYQPDAIKYMEVGGVGYILTANEGDDLGYEAGGDTWEEALRGDKFVKDNMLSNTVSTNLRQALSDDAALGRLQFSTVDGRSAQDPSKFDRLYFFGARSFSVFRADDMSLVYDSGDEMERKHAIYYPEVFNAGGESDDPDDDTPEDMFDGRSDNKGVEPEALETGEFNGKRLLFVAQERTSSVMVYSFPGNSVIPSFESVYRAGGTSKTFTELLNDRNLGDLGPEDLRFIPASDNPSGKPLLLVTSTHSGTLSIYKVTEAVITNSDPSGGSDRIASPRVVGIVTALSLLAPLILHQS